MPLCAFFMQSVRSLKMRVLHEERMVALDMMTRKGTRNSSSNLATELLNLLEAILADGVHHVQESEEEAAALVQVFSMRHVSS